MNLKREKEEYDWYQGSKKHVNKEYQEMSFVVTKENAKMQVIFRIFEDGIDSVMLWMETRQHKMRKQ